MKKKNLNLSKSTLIRSIQCQKSLYLYKNFYNQRDRISPEQKARFDRGHQFGFMAQDLFPGGKDMSPNSPSQYKQSVLATEALIQQNFPVLYEAAFRQNGVLVFLDILVKNNKDWAAYEVKSSRRISPTYIKDAAIQFHVITSTGLSLSDFFLVHVREDYDPGEHHLPEDIFVKVSVWDEVHALSEFIQESIERAKITLMKEDIPDIDMGTHCDQPYPCDFKGHCSKSSSQ